MNEQKLREGLALALKRYEFGDNKDLHAPDSPWRDYEMGKADCALAYLRQHDGHAEFVRAVREIAERAVIRHGSGLGESLGTLSIITALCDAELAKEMSK